MSRTGQNISRLGLIAWAGVILAFIAGTAGAEGLPADKPLQPQGLNHTGIYALRQIEPNLTGDGVKFAVISRSISYVDGEPQNDYRPNINHNCFKSAELSFQDEHWLPAGISPHSTAICSILLGEDPSGFNEKIGEFYYQGAAPAATAEVYEFWHFLTNNIFPQLPPDADIITASIGLPFEDWWTRGIEAMAEHYGIIVVAGIGNGSNAYDPPLYPASGANAIGVGVVASVNSDNLATNLSNFALAYPEQSSTGPTGSSRCKPDIVAIGNCLAADANGAKQYEPTGSWSSFSTPIVAGTIGLLVQKAKEEPDLNMAISPDGGNCVMKAILLNSATKLPYWHKGQLGKDDDHTVPLDYAQGAGMLNAVGAYKNLTAGQNKPGDVAIIGWDNNILNKSETLENIYKIAIPEPNGKVITATVVWNKHYNRTYPFEPRPDKDVNIRLELRAVDPNNAAIRYLLYYSDSAVDNVEHIYYPADANYKEYEIAVIFSNNSQSETAVSERYGLAWSVGDRQNNDSIFWYDLNADGIVNEQDFAIFINNWQNSRQFPESYVLGDIDADGAIDINDVEILLSHRNTEADWRSK
jgi:hypothetical protein